jgi:RNA polymerase-associated protein RTF1
MTKVNERNRKGNREQIKKAESRNQDARMKQTAALARGDTSVKVDASARVKTMPRMNFDR